MLAAGGRPTNLDNDWARLTVFVVGASWGCLDIFSHPSFLSLSLSLSLWDG